jgi:hypothetical protein
MNEDEQMLWRRAAYPKTELKMLIAVQLRMTDLSLSRCRKARVACRCR